MAAQEISGAAGRLCLFSEGWRWTPACDRQNKCCLFKALLSRVVFCHGRHREARVARDWLRLAICVVGQFGRSLTFPRSADADAFIVPNRSRWL